MLRRQPPVWSPLGAAAIWAGVAGRRSPDSLSRLAGALQADFGARGALLVSSGTVALTLALRSLQSAGRPLVALPAYGCYDLATAVVGADVRVALYDVDPATLGPEPESLARVARLGPDAVVVAHFFGVPVDLHRVREIVGPDPIVVDDAAQGAGARFAERPLGTGGDLGVVSFGRGKGRTGGRGGALLATTDRGVELLQRSAGPLDGQASWSFKDLAAVTAQWLLGRPSLYGLPAALPWLRLGETIFHPPPPVERMPAFAAAVAFANRDANLEEDEGRRIAGRWWRYRLRDAPAVRHVAVPPDGMAGWLRYPVISGSEALPVLTGARALGLGVMPGYPHCLAELPGFRDRMVEEEPSPGAALLAGRLFTLPTHSRMTLRDRSRLAALIEGVG